MKSKRGFVNITETEYINLLYDSVMLRQLQHLDLDTWEKYKAEWSDKDLISKFNEMILDKFDTSEHDRLFITPVIDK